MTRPTRTSYSALTTFEECPLSYKLYYMEKIDTPAGAAADRGTRLHKICERYLKGEIDERALPLDFVSIKQDLRIAKELGAKAEEVWLINENWLPQIEEDETTRFKAVVDIHYVQDDELHIWDLKTGKRMKEHEDQLQVYAAIGLSVYPHVKKVTVKGLYLDGFDNVAHYSQAMKPFLQKAWQDRWNTLFQNESWEPTPGPVACRWCSYPKLGLCDSPWARK